jgi:hypothetical protein
VYQLAARLLQISSKRICSCQTALQFNFLAVQTALSIEEILVTENALIPLQNFESDDRGYFRSDEGSNLQNLWGVL